MSKKDDCQELCELCGLPCELTKHHLIPKLRAKNKYKEVKEDPIFFRRNWSDFAKIFKKEVRKVSQPKSTGLLSFQWYIVGSSSPQRLYPLG